MESKLRQLRKARGWTQSELAHRAGLSDSTISSYETGTRLGLLANIKKVASALGVSPSDLLERGGLTLNSSEMVELLLERIEKIDNEQERKEMEYLAELLKLKLQSSGIE